MLFLIWNEQNFEFRIVMPNGILVLHFFHTNLGIIIMKEKQFLHACLLHISRVTHTCNFLHVHTIVNIYENVNKSDNIVHVPRINKGQKNKLIDYSQYHVNLGLPPY